MGAFDEPATYHSGENNNTTGREPFEDTSRDFIHGGGAGNTHAIPGTFGAGVGGGQSTTTTSHHTTTGAHHSGLGGATAGGLTGEGLKNRTRRGSNSSSSSSSDEEVDGVRRKKDKSNRPKKPVGEKIKEAVGMGGHSGAGAAAGTGAVGGVAASHHGQHDSRGIAPGTAGVTGVHQGASHGLHNLHGQRDEFNEGRLGQTGDIPGGHQSGTTAYGTGHNLASDSVTGQQHTGLGSGAGIRSGTTGEYGSNTSASNYASNTSSSGLGSGSHGLGHSSTTEHSHGLGHSGSNMGEDRSAGFNRATGGPGNQGVQGSHLGGAANTDKFDAPREHSSVGTGIGSGPHAQDSGVTRHGPTGDFDNTATAPKGGAYVNDDARTALTGREHTSTGVPDMHGNATSTSSTATHTGEHGAEHSSGGLLGKVKAVLGGH
ncbi:hypothetical protein NCC49_006556 [Naganishia albida]|nr:hypothetical protein NCC49_006556 [Naganishia albida]